MRKDIQDVDVTWDNYDHFVELLSEKDTLHNTIGICYQSLINKNDETFQFGV